MGSVKEICPEEEDVGSFFGRRSSTARRNSEIPSLAALKIEGVHGSELPCLDDEIERGGMLESQSELQGRILQSGEYFGEVSFGSQPTKRVKNYYIADSGCQMLILSQRVCSFNYKLEGLTQFSVCGANQRKVS